MQEYDFKKLNDVASANNLIRYQQDLVQQYNCPVPKSTPDNMKVRITPIKSHKDLLKIYELNRNIAEIMGEVSDGIGNTYKNVRHIDEYVYERSCQMGLFPSTLGYNGFPKSVSINVNEEVCHNLPRGRILKEGDIVTVDFVEYDGKYHTDMAHTFPIGRVTPGDRLLLHVTDKVLEKALNVCKPLGRYCDIGRVIEKVAEDNGVHVIEKFTGHGIGEYIHMKPRVYNRKSDICEEMNVGDMFTIEPLLTTGNGKVKKKRDGFGYVTADKSNVAHIERVVLITDGGCKVLNELT